MSLSIKILSSALGANALTRYLNANEQRWHLAPSTSLFLVIWSTFTVLSVILSTIYIKLNDPLKDIPRVQFPDRISALRACVAHPDYRLLVDTAKQHPEADFIRYDGLRGDGRLVVLSKEARREIFSHQAYASFEKAPILRKLLRFVTGNGLLTSEGDEHKSQRRGLMPAFSLQHVRSLAPIMWQKSAELIDTMGKNIGDSGEHVPIFEWTSKAALDIIGVATWGNDFSALSEPDNDLVDKYRGLVRPGFTRLQRIAMMLLPMSVSMRLPTQSIAKVRIGSSAIRAQARKVVQERGATKTEDRKDILSVAIRSGIFTHEQLVEQLLTFLSAGHETSATGAMYACFYLACYPDVQERLRTEVRGNLPSPSSAEEISWKDLESLDYLCGVSLETLRMCPPVPAPQRVALGDTTICGQVIPKGSVIINNLWVNSRLGWEDPERFDPDRWLGESADKFRNGSTAEFEFSPFNHGVRNCIGQSFARLEQLALVAALAGRFRMEIDDTHLLPPRLDIVALPIKPIKIRMRPIDGW